MFEQFFPGHTSSVDIGTGVGCRRPLPRRRNDYVEEVWLLLFVYFNTIVELMKTRAGAGAHLAPDPESGAL